MNEAAERLPRTAAGRALVEWAANAMPAEQQDIWREHALLIEHDAQRMTVERIRAEFFMRRADQLPWQDAIAILDAEAK